jgi:MFS transporter, DHA1 family, inner membrane transport protein
MVHGGFRAPEREGVSTAAAQAPAAFPTRALWSLSLSYFIVGTSSLSVVGLVKPMADGLGVPVSLIAILVTVFALTFAVAALVGQMLGGGLPPKRLMLGGFAVLAAGTILSAFAPNYAVMVASRMLMAIGAAVIGPVASALGGSLVPPEKRGAALAIVFSGMTVATVAGVPITNFTGTMVGWREALLLIALAGLLSAALIWHVVPEGVERPAPTLTDFKRLLSRPPIAWALLATLLHMACQFVTYALIGPLLVERYSFELAFVPLGLFVYGFGGVAGNALSGALADRLGAGRVTTGCLTMMIALLLLIWVMPPWPVTVVVLMAVWSTVALAFFAPNQMHLVAHAGPAAGLVLALNASALYVGMSAGAALSGVLYEFAGPSILPLGSAIVAALALICYRNALRV